MRGGTVHRVLRPTIWGYATLTRRSHPALAGGGGTRRVDTVLPPVLTPDELDGFHDVLRGRAGPPGPWRVGVTGSARVRRALRLAVDVRTTAALHPEPDVPRRTTDVALAALARAMREADRARLGTAHQALARELVWGALVAARTDEASEVTHAARALALLASTNVGGGAADRIDHG